jgi:hypothetical protein
LVSGLFRDGAEFDLPRLIGKLSGDIPESGLRHGYLED